MPSNSNKRSQICSSLLPPAPKFVSQSHKCWSMNDGTVSEMNFHFISFHCKTHDNYNKAPLPVQLHWRPIELTIAGKSA